MKYLLILGIDAYVTLAGKQRNFKKVCVLCIFIVYKLYKIPDSVTSNGRMIMKISKAAVVA